MAQADFDNVLDGSDCCRQNENARRRLRPLRRDGFLWTPTICDHSQHSLEVCGFKRGWLKVSKSSCSERALYICTRILVISSNPEPCHATEDPARSQGSLSIQRVDVTSISLSVCDPLFGVVQLFRLEWVSRECGGFSSESAMKMQMTG